MPSFSSTLEAAIHNALGQAYMAVVTPFHRHIVRAMLQRLADHGQR